MTKRDLPYPSNVSRNILVGQRYISYFSIKYTDATVPWEKWHNIKKKLKISLSLDARATGEHSRAGGGCYLPSFIFLLEFIGIDLYSYEIYGKVIFKIK